MMCPHCGRRRDPDAYRATLGTFIFAPILLVVVLGGGWLGFRIGTWLAPLVRMQGLPLGVSALFAINGFWFVPIWYVRWVGGRYRDLATRDRLHLMKLPLFAGAISGLEVHGLSGWMIVWIAGNGLVGYVVVQLVLPEGRDQQVSGDSPSSL